MMRLVRKQGLVPVNRLTLMVAATTDAEIIPATVWLTAPVDVSGIVNGWWQQASHLNYKPSSKKLIQTPVPMFLIMDM